VNAGATVSAIDAAGWLTWLRTPVVAVTATVEVPPDPLPVIVAVVCVVVGGVTVAGLNEHVEPEGRPVQAKPTEPVKLFLGTTVIVAVPLCPEKTLMVVVGELAVKSGGLASATAKLFKSREPSPVARSKPVELE
jgi:hypothetical protein